MIGITTSELAAIIYGAAATLIVGFILGFIGASRFVKKVEVKPVYPLKGMHKNFSIIEDDIKACKNKKDLRDVYLSIFAFEALYADSASFTSELYEKYDMQRKELLKQKEVLSKA